VAHELDALRLAARQRRAGTVEAQVSEADVVEVLEPARECVDERRDAHVVDRAHEARQLARLHRRAVRDPSVAHAGRARRVVEARPVACRARALRRDPLDGRADVRLQPIESPWTGAGA
jgi:hypothetical protein